MNKLLSLLLILAVITFCDIRCGNSPSPSSVVSTQDSGSNDTNQVGRTSAVAPLSSARDSSNDTSSPKVLSPYGKQLQSARDSSNDTSGPKARTTLKLKSAKAAELSRNKKDS